MTWWRHPVTWWREHPRYADLVLALALAALGLISTASPGHITAPTRQANAWAYVLVLAGTLPLVARRRRPCAVLAATAGATLLSQLFHFPESVGVIGPVVAAYSVGSYVQSRRRLQVTAGALLAVLVAGNAIAAIVEQKAQNLFSAVGNGIVFGTAFLAGDNMRRRRQRLADLEARALAEDATREALAREAGAAERQRIARELHDVVAHSLSVIVVQAGAARRLVATKPERAAEALAAIETTGRNALDEMRHLLGVLRSTAGLADLAPQPSLTGLDALAAADPALPVAVCVEGEPVPLSAVVELQAYRIVQEALTNVRKHAGPARATVRVRYGLDAIELHVDDDGRGASAVDGGGNGLVGMRERAALCGGELRAGPRPGGGWSVTARLPLAAGSGR